MPISKRTLISALLTLLIISANSYAVPVIKLCVDENCRKPVNINISESCWSEVNDIFSLPFPTDKDEQDNIANAIALIEYDVYHSLSKQAIQSKNANNLYISNSNKNDYKNLKTYLGILLDSHLVRHHFIRKILTQKSWNGLDSNGLLLQSLTDSKLYILQVNNTRLGQSPIITDYVKTTTTNDSKVPEQTGNKLDDANFE